MVELGHGWVMVWDIRTSQRGKHKPLMYHKAKSDELLMIRQTINKKTTLSLVLAVQQVLVSPL